MSLEPGDRVRRVAFDHPSFGYRRVWSVLRGQEGMFINRKRVRRILREEGLQKEVHSPRPRLRETGNLSAPEPDQRWYADLTYVDTTDLGPVPLMVVMDACTREVVGHELLRSGRGGGGAVGGGARRAGALPEDGASAGAHSKDGRRRPVRCPRFQEGCRTIGISLMATRKRRPEDNGMMESWNGHFKRDYLWIREPMTFLETRRVVDEGVVDYNTQRPHSSLEYLTPSEYAERKKEEQRA